MTKQFAKLTWPVKYDRNSPQTHCWENKLENDKALLHFSPTCQNVHPSFHYELVFRGHLCQETFHLIKPASVEEVRGGLEWGRRGRSDSGTRGQWVQLWGLDSLREGIKGATWSLPGGLRWTRERLVPSWLAGSCSRNSSCYSRHLAPLQTGWAAGERAAHKGPRTSFLPTEQIWLRGLSE